MDTKRQPLLITLLTIGVILDLIIGGVLIALNSRVSTSVAKVNKVANVADCWDKLLKDVVLLHPTHSVILYKAHVCAEIPDP